MTIDVHPQRTPENIVAQQKADAENLRRQKADAARQQAAVPATIKASVPAAAVVDNRTAQQRYLDEVAPTSIVGRLIKFDKNGQFVTSDDGQAVSETVDFFALCGETQVGWIRFGTEEGVPPERHMGLLFDGYVMPSRDSLGDLDPTEWQPGLSGGPEDPCAAASRHQRTFYVFDDIENGPPRCWKFAETLQQNAQHFAR